MGDVREKIPLGAACRFRFEPGGFELLVVLGKLFLSLFEFGDGFLQLARANVDLYLEVSVQVANRTVVECK